MMTYGATDEEAGASPRGAAGACAAVRVPKAALVVATIGLWALAFGGTLPSSSLVTGSGAAATTMVEADTSKWCAGEGAYATRADLCNGAAPALGGADVVAYRSAAWAAGGAERAPHVAGDPRYAADFNGYEFLFSSSANRDAFAADPKAYAPKTGGFCAFGLTGADPRNRDPRLATLHTMPVDPDVWWLDDSDALYLFRGDGAMRLFLEDAGKNAALAEATWLAVVSGPEAFCPGAALYNTACLHDASAPAMRAPH